MTELSSEEENDDVAVERVKCQMRGGKFLRKITKTPIFVAKITKTPLLNRHFISLSTYDNLYK